ncbi:MAG: glutaredoxin [Gammaproteobacteria bacterium]|nr:glutaredoxin [Gammaproteobacteria bacterium]
MSRVTIYSREDCPVCSKAKTMLGKWSIDFEEIPLDNESAKRDFNEATNSADTVPQIIIDGKLIGGFSELTELHMDGDLDNLMEQA